MAGTQGGEAMTSRAYARLYAKHDALRQLCKRVAAHLEVVAHSESEAAIVGLPPHTTAQERARLNAAFMRGEAKLLHEGAEEIDG